MQRYTWTVIVLQPNQIELAEGVTLLKNNEEDVEREYPFDMFTTTSKAVPREANAVLTIESQARGGGEIQRQVEQGISILRLFKVGSVKYYSIQMETSSLVDPLGNSTLRSGDNLASFDKYVITDAEVERIRTFWHNLGGLIPSSLYSPTGTEDSITIAYKRYNDALFQNGQSKDE